MATFRFDAKDLINALEDADTKAQIAIKMYSQEGAKKFQNYAKANRPWQDRTGQARQRLIGWVEMFKTKVRINVGHGVSYGIHLEMAHEKRYAILQPTIIACSKEVLQGFEGLIKHLK